MKIKKYSISIHVVDQKKSNENESTASLEEDTGALDAEMACLLEKFQLEGCKNEDKCIEFSRKTNVLVFAGKCALVYTHPEAIISPSCSVHKMLISSTYQKHVVACVIDEAHCIVDWGTKYLYNVFT